MRACDLYINAHSAHLEPSLIRIQLLAVAKLGKNKAIYPLTKPVLAAQIDAFIDFSSSAIDGPIYPVTRQIRGIDAWDKQASYPASPTLSMFPVPRTPPPPRVPTPSHKHMSEHASTHSLLASRPCVS